MPGSEAGRPPFPERVGRYELLLPLASGGMGAVYLARSTGLAGFEREVALKLTHSHLRESAGFATALVDEANLAGRIRHQNVVSVLDVGEDPAGVYLVMDYVEGETLAGLIRHARETDTRIPESIALRILDDVLAGLHAAHELRDNGVLVGLVHRDVTPHNVLVGIDGTSKLTDFGVAKAATRIAVTATGLIKGKVAYMAPEQALGRPLDRRCDIWAVGVVLWELLSGMRLHTVESEAATLLRIVSEPPPRVRSVRPDVAPQLDELVARALDMDRTRRFANAEEFRRALVAAADMTHGRADAHTVGEYVRQQVGTSLVERRDQVAEVLALRGRLGRITRDALPSVVPTPSPMVQVPPARDDATVVDAPRPSDPAAAATAAMPALERLSEPPGEATRTETISVATTGSDPKGERRKWSVRVGAAAAVALGVGALALSAPWKGGTEPEQSATASEPPPGSTSESTDDPAIVTPENLAVAPDDLPLETPEPAGREVTLRAASPFRSVYVGKRHIELETAAREQTIVLGPDEVGKWVSIVATDGRRGTTRLDEGVEQIDVTLRAAGRTPPPTKPQPKKPGGLLTNPYGGKP